MNHLIIFFLIALITYQWIPIASHEYLIQEEAKNPYCMPCEYDCDKCTYGTFENECKELQCARGPDESCAGPQYQQDHMCGDGLYCKCNICRGCFYHNDRPIECSKKYEFKNCHKPNHEPYILAVLDGH